MITVSIVSTVGIAARSKSLDALRDTLADFYQSWTSVIPDAPTMEWMTNKSLGGNTKWELKQAVRSTPEFRSRYTHMPAGMNVKEYDEAHVRANAMAIDIAGRDVKDHELALRFSGDGDSFYESLKGDED